MTAKPAKTDKPTQDLKTFIENVNKKDKLNGRIESEVRVLELHHA